MNNQINLIRKYRISMGLFILGLLLSGITAFPIVHELVLVISWLDTMPNIHLVKQIIEWLTIIRDGFEIIYSSYPWVGYGTDWLGFAHIIIAFYYIPNMLNPQKGKENIIVGLIACFLIIPFAFVAGHIRSIPIFWSVIDSMFGVFGAIPLVYCYKLQQKIT